jgi:hypothetical protein
MVPWKTKSNALLIWLVVVVEVQPRTRDGDPLLANRKKKQELMWLGAPVGQQ